MNVLTRKRLEEYAAKFPDARTFLENWRDKAKQARWRSIVDLRADYPHADPVAVKSGHTATIFNVCGNKYRLVTAIHYNTQRVFVLRMMTHAEYDKEKWKREL